MRLHSNPWLFAAGAIVAALVAFGPGTGLAAGAAAAAEPSAATSARVIALYAAGQRSAPRGVLADYSGFDHPALLEDGARLSGGLLDLTHGYVSLPAGQALWGPWADRGAVAFWVRPAFDPATVGYAMLFYCMRTDGNALPDGYDEIGIYLDHGALVARFVGPAAVSPVASLPAATVLPRGRWTHLALAWRPGFQCFYVDGRVAAASDISQNPPRLDAFRAEIGRHPSSKHFFAPGQYADVTLFDDFPGDAAIARLASSRPPAAAQTASPAPPPVISACDWARPWAGHNKVTVTLTDPLTTPLSLRVGLEVSTGASFARREVAAERRDLAPGAKSTVSLPYDLAGDGPARLEVLVRRAGSGALLAGRLRYVYLPPVLSAITAAEGRLDAAEKQALPPAAHATLEAARAKLRALRASFLAGPPAATRTAAGSQASAAAALEDQVHALSAQVDQAVSKARIAAAAQGKPFALGWTHGTIKVLKSDPFPGQLEQPIALDAARNEYEPAQLFVFATGHPLDHVKLTLSPLTGPGGATIPASDLTWRVVGYITTTKPSYAVRFVGPWPDLLRREPEFSVAAGQHGIAWITVKVPRDAEPGDYEGRVEVTCSSGTRSLPLRLHVWGFTLPERSSLKTAFGLNSCGRWQKNMNIAAYVRDCAEHRVSLGFPGILWSGPKIQHPSFGWTADKRLTVVASGSGSGLTRGKLFVVCDAGDGSHAAYGPFALAAAPRGSAAPPQAFLIDLHKPLVFRSLRFEWRGAGPVEVDVRKLTLTDASGATHSFDSFRDPTWWQATGPDATVSVAGGRLRLTVAAPTAATKLYAAWPAAERSADTSPADRAWKIDWTAFDAAVEKYYPWAANVIWLPLPGVPRDATLAEAKRLVAENGLARVAADAQQHLAARGWLKDAYTYLWDEPEARQYPVVNYVTGVVKRAAPRLLNMMTARGFPPALHYIDIWCPEVYSFNPAGAARQRAEGKHIWWYVAFSCRHPYPNFWIDYPAIDCRAAFWLTWKEHIKCFLYWSISNWGSVDNPFTQQTFRGANGDGTLIYPGADGKPIDTIRWENIRDGLEDYEYFVLLRDALAKAQAAGRAPAALVAKARKLLAIDPSVVRDYAHWSQDPAVYFAARREMARTIEALTGS